MKIFLTNKRQITVTVSNMKYKEALKPLNNIPEASPLYNWKVSKFGSSFPLSAHAKLYQYFYCMWVVLGPHHLLAKVS